MLPATEERQLARMPIIVGEQVVALNGVSVDLTIPTNANGFILRARGGDVYWSVNASPASPTTSGGYCMNGTKDVQYPVSNLNSGAVYGTAGAYAHIQYFRYYNA